MSAAVIRRATYRVQLHRDFGFDAAAELSDYLHDLGVSHLYCSPWTQAVPGSTHGYDVVDPGRLSDDLGGEEANMRLRAALRARGMSILLDVVPNHMAAHPHNRWWWDVLEDGERSPLAPRFDVDWSGLLDPRMRGRVMLPVLGDHVGRVVERDELRLERRADGRIVVAYHDFSAPLSLPSLAPLLHAAAEATLSAVLAAAARGAAALRDDDVDPGVCRAERDAMWDEVRRACEDDDIAATIDAQLETVMESSDSFDALLRAQPHRLARWRLGLREVNYRRFFDILSLVALRAEDDATFVATHRLALDMLHAGELDGLRIDHVDGLRDPGSYLRRLRAAAGADAWIVVEKILDHGESLSRAWPVSGTTGYEVAALTTRLLTDPVGEAPLLDLLAEMGGSGDVAMEAREAKLQVMAQTLAADVERLVVLLRRVCDRRPRHRDHGVDELRAALCEVIAALPVYRTYAVPGEPVGADDELRVRRAVEAVRGLRSDIDRELLGLIAALIVDNAERDGDEDATELVMRLQQLSSAVMAKGMEDTAFYRLVQLASLSEVGGGPVPFSIDARGFHEHNVRVQQRWPETLLATTTHDTKRSEDVRARLSLLSQMPERWAQTVRAWRDRNARQRRGGRPDGVMEYLLYQTMVGAWPIEHARMAAYMEKAAREAKVHTSWIDPSPAYESALQDFVAALYADGPFLEAVEEFTAPLVHPGRVNSLAMVLLKLTSPGVPDIYQGCELWTLTLVDPDNRRPVDHEQRQALLRRSLSMSSGEAWRDEADSGLPKLLLTRRALLLRQRHPEVFGIGGAYTPLDTLGACADRVVAFARGAVPGAVTVVPRLVLGIDDWQDTFVRLPDGEWHDQLGDRVHRGEARVADLLGDFPVALLARSPFVEAVAA